MKRIISLLSIICLLICGFVLNSSATENGINTFIYEEKEITVENPELTYEEMNAIADVIAGIESEPQANTRGILCIFGHKLTTSEVTEITHNVYTTTPKCVQNKYEVESCTRTNCDYIEKTLTSSIRIKTCHG